MMDPRLQVNDKRNLIVVEMDVMKRITTTKGKYETMVHYKYATR